MESFLPLFAYPVSTITEIICLFGNAMLSLNFAVSFEILKAM